MKCKFIATLIVVVISAMILKLLCKAHMKAQSPLSKAKRWMDEFGKWKAH
jgi:hypothetical protein